MLGIVTRYAFEVFEVPEEHVEILRTISDPSFKGQVEPSEILGNVTIDGDELRELVLIDGGEVIFNGTL